VEPQLVRFAFPGEVVVPTSVRGDETFLPLLAAKVHDINRFVNTNFAPGRLRTVASDFLSLQGLHQVALGILLLLVFAALKLNRFWDVWLFPALVVAMGIASWRIRVYYERQFGYVQVRSRPGFWGAGHIFLKRGLFCILVILLIVAWVKMFNLSLTSSVGLAGCILGLLFVGFFVTENRPWYYLLFSLPFFGIAGAARFLHEPSRLLWPQLWLFPVALIVTGVLDHLRLVRSLPGARSDGAA